MRRTTFAASILIIASLFVFAALGLNYTFEGPIEGLVFLFYPDSLPFSVPGIEADVAFVLVETEGREHIVVTPSGQFSYSANLDAGTIYAWEEVAIITDDDGNVIDIQPDGDPIVLDMESGKLSEHFTIEGPIPEDPNDVEVPDDVNLYFKAKLLIDGETINYQLLIKDGQVAFIRP